jgi:hypothetical protein
VPPIRAPSAARVVTEPMSAAGYGDLAVGPKEGATMSTRLSWVSRT